MFTTIKRSILATLILALILCGVYPLLVTGVGNLLFPKQSKGSLIQNGDKVIGSELLAQDFENPGYFHERPSAAGNGYDPLNSGGSNLGPTSQKLKDRIDTDMKKILADNPTLKASDIPVDMITTSGSGLDPHISPANALAQAARIADNRGVSLSVITDLINKHTEPPQLGIFGEPVVNVLVLNMDLDSQSGAPKPMPVAPAATPAAP